MDTMRESLKRLHDSKSHNDWREFAGQVVAQRATVLPQLLLLLNDPDATIRTDTIRVLAWFQLDDEIVSHLRGVVNDLDYEVRFAAGSVFVDNGNASTLLPLLEFLAEDEGELWIICSDYFRKLGDSTLPGLVEAMSDPRPEIRSTAADAIGSEGRSILGLIHAPPELIALLKDDNHKVRQEAIWAIRCIRDHDCLSHLTNALQDIDPGVRYAAKAAIEEFTKPQN